ncbi:MAG TPA: hypothetical protein PKC44_06880 [Agitococcus sp.]|nr:hypothetical protein [Agitococcus sp.]
MNTSTQISTTAVEYKRNIKSYENKAYASEDYKSFGKYWAATSGTRVVSLMLIPTIDDKEVFEAFREKSREALSLVGEVATGEVVLRDGRKVFVKRMSRNNRTTGKAAQRPEPIFSIPFYMQ